MRAPIPPSLRTALALALPLCAALGLSGCRTLASPDELGRELVYQRVLETPEGRFRVDLPTPTPSVEAMVLEAVWDAGPRLAQWGKLEQPVTVFVLPDHAALERAIPARLDTLRAWGSTDHVYLQSPTSWGPDGANLRQVTDLLTHELTHTLMFQLAGADTPKRRLQFPVWFREGMALYTADQGDTVPTLETIAAYLRSGPEYDPLRDADHMYDGRTAFDMAYGSALHAFRFLVERYGATSVRTLLNAMRAGATFPAAFTASVGIPPDVFVQDFETYVRLRGFAQGRARRLQPLERGGGPDTLPPAPPAASTPP